MASVNKVILVGNLGADPDVRYMPNGGWYDAVAALRGVIEFHQLAQARYGYPADVEALIKFANKLEASSPLFEEDIAKVRACIAACKRQALQLRLSQADDIVKTIQISMRIDSMKEAA